MSVEELFERNKFQSRTLLRVVIKLLYFIVHIFILGNVGD